MTDATSTLMSHEELDPGELDAEHRLKTEQGVEQQMEPEVEAKEVVSIPALSYPHLIDSIFASAPYASLLALRAAGKDFHQRASNILGSHLILSSRGSGRSTDPLRIDISSYSYATRRTKHRRFTLTRASPTSTTRRAEPLAQWLAKEALPDTLDLDNWGKGRWWLPASVRTGVEGLRPRTVRIYAASGSQMATWDRPTERTVVFAAIPPWSHEAVRVIPAPEVPETRKMVVNLTVHERGRHLPLGELAAWDSLPDTLGELVIIVKDAEEKSKTFVPRPATSNPVRHTAASLARTKAAQKTKGAAGGGGGVGGDRATRQEWGVLHPLYSWLISAWRSGGIRALMRDGHAIRLTLVGMTEVRPNHAGFANSTTPADRAEALEGYRRSIADVWRSIPKNFEPAPRPGSRHSNRGGSQRAASALSVSGASTATSTAPSNAFSELSLAPSTDTAMTSPSPLPQVEEFWTQQEVDKVVDGIRFLTYDEYKASCPKDWAMEFAV